MKYFQKYGFILIFVIGIGLRFYQLGDIPVGFHRDEAFLGYNAYSILKTGRDMTGHLLPLHFESFIQSPGGYSYASIPFISFFGLSPYSVRFASAFFGSLTVLLTYFLVGELIKNRLWISNHELEKKTNSKFGIRSNTADQWLPLLASLLLAFSPWHINLSRTATENTIVVFFITLGMYLFLKYLEFKKIWIIIFSFFSFFITFGLYQAPRAFLPIFIPCVLAIFWRILNKKDRMTTISLYICFIALPVILILTSPQLSLRLRTVNIFYAEETRLVIDEQVREDGTKSIPIFLTRFFHNKPVAYGKEIIGNYFKHFSYPFLFSDAGLPPRYTIYRSGLLYIFELPLLLLGLYILARRHTRSDFLILTWFFLAPLGSALTFDDIPNLQRTLIVFPALSIIIANGIIFLLTKVRQYNRLLTLPLIGIISIIASYEILYYFHQYYVQQQVHRPWYRHEGYKELVASVNSVLSRFDKAVITTSESAPAIFFLFFGNYDPSTFQKETKNASILSIDRVNFSKYEFTQEECPYKENEEIDKQTNEKIMVHTANPGILYVNYGICKNISKTGNTLKTIVRGDNTPVFKVVELK